jgi:hypothetical protein
VWFEQYGRVIGRPTGRFRIDTLKAHLAQVQLIDKSFDNPHRIIRTDVIIDTIGQQTNLSLVRAFDESLHGVGPRHELPYFIMTTRFYTASASLRHSTD